MRTLRHPASIFTALTAILLGSEVAAQTLPIDAASVPTEDAENDALRDIARTGDTGIGEVGRRLTADDAAPNLEPLGRIDSRIQSRIQSRLRNRVDRNYDPNASAKSTIDDAVNRSRSTGRPR